MLRFLLLAVLLACVSAFVPPATLAQRSVVGRAASVEMGASKGNINLLKKPKAAPKKALRGFLAGNFLGDGKGGSGDAKSRKAGAKYRTDGSLIVRHDLSFAGHRRRRRHLLARI